MYQGGKSKISKPIAEILRSSSDHRSTYVEPFLGSAAVFHLVAPAFSRSIGADAVEDLCLMWSAAISGWTPPETLSPDEYAALRNAPPSALRAFAGFPCSFGGKWFGGYARDPHSDRNYARTASRSIVKRATPMKGSEVRHCDYRELEDVIGPDSVVYCDPPYANTTAYAGAGCFNSRDFWKVADSWVNAGALVYVSEYSAPEHWREVWSAERHVSTSLHNSGAKAVDRLFISTLSN